ncbi:MAG TPA: dihydrofolate reductase family protein [Actinomycetota bacterium]|nr:dihydrofolate reductase family protein [Actinomycetota bacterium]
MPKLRVHNFSLSLDGYGAGPDQSVDNPLGIGGQKLHDWAWTTRTFQAMIGSDTGEENVDDSFASRTGVGLGATILGRNMFGPVRGPWPDGSWKGWWGPNPPYHHPTFVLTHYARDPVPMEGGTTFYFVTDGIESALEQAFAAAQGKDVWLAGGASTIQQYLRAGLVDEAHLAIGKALLGGGERFFDHLEGAEANYEVAEWVGTSLALHVVLVKR